MATTPTDTAPAPTGDHAPRRRPPAIADWRLPTVAAAVLALLAQLAALVVARIVLGGSDVEQSTVVLAVAAPVGLVLGLVAVSRFEWFVWIVLAVRPSLDAFRGRDVALAPGAMLAAAFLTAAAVWLVVRWRAGTLRPPSTPARVLLVFGGAVAVSVVTSTLRSVSALAALEIFAGIAMFLVLEQLLAGRPDRARRLIAAVLGGALVPLAVGWIQWAGGDVTGTRTDIGRIRSTFVHPNPFATYLVLVILLAVSVATAVHGRRRWMLTGYVLALGGMLVVTYNRSGWIAITVGLLYVGFRRSRWIIAGFVAALLLVPVAFPQVLDRLADLGETEDAAYIPDDVPANSFEWRLQYWESLVPMANESPVTGLGPQVIVNTRPEELEPHNVFVQVYVEIGLLGLVSLLAVIVAIARELRRRRLAASDEIERSLAVGAIAVALAVLVMAPSENLLNQTMSWWYLAACATWGFTRLADRRTSPDRRVEPAAERARA